MGSRRDAETLKNILSLFSKATGMEINEENHPLLQIFSLKKSDLF
jgi:hypothetical protein